MFQFARFPSHTLWYGWLCIITAGFLHSDVCGSPIICISPQLFAACHVLRRQISPRHPPYALSILTYVVFTLTFVSFGFENSPFGFFSEFPSVRRKNFSFVKSFFRFFFYTVFKEQLRVMVLSKPNSTSRFPMSDLHVLKVSLKRVSLERR